MPCSSAPTIECRAEPAPSTLEILSQRSAWGTFFGLFCGAYVLYFFLTWLPYYLVRERHFSMGSMAKIGASIYATQALAAILSGRLSDRWVAKGFSPSRVRRGMVVVSTGAAGFFLVLAVVASRELCIGLLVLVGASYGVFTAGTWPITQTLAGPRASGRWTGLQCAFANSSGALVAAVTGFLLQRTGHFLWPFVIAATLSCASALCWIFLVGPIEPVRWKRSAPTARVRKIQTQPV